jgi:spore germination protein YaaH
MPLMLATLLALGGWIVPWQRDAGTTSVDRAQGALDDVFLFAAQLDATGHPVVEGSAAAWAETVQRVQSRGAKAWLTIVNDRVAATGPPVLKDAEVLHRVLAGGEARAQHEAEIVAMAERLHVNGVDIDYESLPASDRELFSTFADELAPHLRQAGLAFSVPVQPKSGDPAARGPGAMDWPRLCRTADRVQVMLYNEHNASTEPGPIAGLDWISRVIDYGLGSCPVAKLVPVLKVSGMDWGPEKAEWRSFPEAAALRTSVGAELKRERVNRVPWFIYQAGDGRHVVYFEDAKSLQAKAERLRARGLTTIVLWSLGSEDPESISRLAERARPARKSGD